MRLRATDVNRFYRPKPCDLRVFLGLTGVEPAGEASRYEEVLRRLGERHELAHLTSFPDFLNLRAFPSTQRLTRTRTALQDGTGVLYQPLFTAAADLAGEPCEIVGEPDLILAVPGGHVVREVKLARRVGPKDHPEIGLQLQIYGWLYAQAVGRPPARLEVLTGADELTEVPHDPGTALEALADLVRLARAPEAPYAPVGWSKCSGCGYRERCWSRAEADQDVALVPGVDQGLARRLRAEGVERYPQLRERYDAARLAGVERASGEHLKRVGAASAESILRHAAALVQDKEIWLHPPAVPDSERYVVFDLEGLPPQLEDLDKIYLWGLRVYGDRPGPYRPALAGFGPDGDREGWEAFLALAREVFAESGDAPWLHWHTYERTKVTQYVHRFGDPNGTAARVLDRLCDLHRITTRAVALPVYSYSLKVVEKRVGPVVGFRRRLAEGRGDWSMAKYIEAVETEDAQAREECMREILMYNDEDLQATWAVFQWLRQAGRPAAGHLEQGTN
jgi:predicted RecB family nuclease